MAEIKIPNITATTEQGQLQQIKTYLFQLTGQLNFALKDTERLIRENGISSNAGNGKALSHGTEEEQTQKSFNDIKNLIIKSADIVNAYYEVISQKLEGVYVAESDFGQFKQETAANFTATSTNLEQHYSSIQEIQSELENINELRRDSCYIKTGWLDDNETIAGVEIGKYSETENGTDIGFARFTTDEMCFYDGNGIEEKNKLAVFGKHQTTIRNLKVTGDFELGGYIADTSDGIAYKWVGDD